MVKFLVCRIRRRGLPPFMVERTRIDDPRPVVLRFPPEAKELVGEYNYRGRYIKPRDMSFYRRMFTMGVSRSDADELYQILSNNPDLCKEEEVVEEKYIEKEYARYYKYLPSEQYKQRHFEARGTFTIPPGIDPDSQKVYDFIERLFDNDVMVGALGIEIDENWEIDWVSGAEEKGKTESFKSRVRVTVIDKRIPPRVGPYNVDVTVSENDFGEPRE